MPVCITGMHRSGTSMVAQLMSESGLYLGPRDEIMPAAEQNPEGFWEHTAFVELNEEILSRLGGGWDCPPPLTSDWSGSSLADLRPRAEAVFEDLARNNHWGWKDPRTCLTLPFWQSLLDPLQVILVVRNPLEVASSLRERNGFSLALGLTLWRISYERALAAVPVSDRVVTHFDAYFTRPETEHQRVLAGIGLEPLPVAVEQPRRGGIDRLRHHRFSALDLAEARVDRSIRDLYAALCREAEWDGDATDPMPAPFALDPAVQDLGAVDTVSAGIGGVNRLTVENGLLRQALDQLRDEHHREISARDEQIDRMNTELTYKVQALSEISVTATELDAPRAAVSDQADRLSLAETRLNEALAYEDDLREQLTSAHQQLVYRDSEVMATLGIALARHSPGAPAAIYYRQLLDRVGTSVIENLPPGAPVAVATMGDEAMLKLDGRQAWHFPSVESAMELAYSTSDTEDLLAQLETLRQAGAQYLLLPAASWSWSARYPKLNRWIETIYHSLVRDDGVCHIYDLRVRKPTATGTV